MGSQTDAVLSLSLVTPITKQFYDYFYNTLSESGMKILGTLLHKDDPVLFEIPMPCPRLGTLPLFGHDLLQKPPVMKKIESILKKKGTPRKTNHLNKRTAFPRYVMSGLACFYYENEINPPKCHVCNEMFTPKTSSRS